ncbi:hypothetical protein Ciccas_001261 [Cichlidogyrus casuarinus]|uniref:Uncharacterized protein n=1 Tax=Cichlidogyrus casuarinus TaxID=1844966 RepID=A0ABD2QKN6_9PLAT
MLEEQLRSILDRVPGSSLTYNPTWLRIPNPLWPPYQIHKEKASQLLGTLHKISPGESVWIENVKVEPSRNAIFIEVFTTQSQGGARWHILWCNTHDTISYRHRHQALHGTIEDRSKPIWIGPNISLKGRISGRDFQSFEQFERDAWCLNGWKLMLFVDCQALVSAATVFLPSADTVESSRCQRLIARCERITDKQNKKSGFKLFEPRSSLVLLSRAKMLQLFQQPTFDSCLSFELVGSPESSNEPDLFSFSQQEDSAELDTSPPLPTLSEIEVGFTLNHLVRVCSDHTFSIEQ